MSNLTEHQQEVFDRMTMDIQKGLNGNSDFTLISLNGYAGCVDMDTEYLTESGWKKISKYSDGEKILQWNDDGSTQFIVPEYTKVKCDTMNHIKTNTIDMVLSDGHRVPYLTVENNLKVKSFFQLKDQSVLKIPRGFNSPKLNGIDISDDLIRVLIMQSADGTVLPMKQFKISINVKKDRKKTRVIELLNNANINYTITKGEKDYIRVNYYPPKEIAVKSLFMLWGCSESQLMIAYDELVKWDGSIAVRKNVTTKLFYGNKLDVDVCQYIFSVVSGNYSSMKKDNREYKKEDLYYVSESSRNISTIQLDGNRYDSKEHKSKISEFKTLDGYQYCFTTPSTFWLARRNGKIFPTGNTGKTFLLSELIKHFNDSYKQTVTGPTHKSVKVIVDTLKENNCPKIDSRTIHSFLKLKLEDDHDSGKQKLSKNLWGDSVDDRIDILWTDESSMVSNELLEYAVDKIAEGTLKVIVMIGDIFQLLPVDDNNTSEFIKMEKEYRLTEIVRQSLDNPIIATSQIIKEYIENEVYPPIDADLFSKLTVVSGRKEFMTRYFDDDTDKKIGTYTNKMAQRYNNYVRNLTKDSPKECLMKGDFLEFQDTLYNGQKLIHLNSETVEVASCTKMHDTYYNMSYWNVIDTKFVAFPVLDFEDKPEFEKRLNNMAKKASSTKDVNERKQKWGQYFALKNKYANVRYHYCSTLHRLQGSTVDNIYLDLSDLNNPWYDMDTVYRLIYVGITRARNNAIILL